MALNVPYQSQNLQPAVSLADSVGQWQTIKNQQQVGELARAQEQRLTDQSAREAKTGDLQFQMTQHKALKEIATDFRSNLQRKAQEMGLKQGTPEYQQLANAMFTNNYNSTFQNITGKSHQPGTDIDLSAIDAVAGMTPQEELQQKIEGQKAEWDAHLPYQMQVAQAQAGVQEANQARQFAHQDRADERNYQQSLGLEDIRHRNDLESQQLKADWDMKLDDIKASRPKPMTEYQQANLEAKQDAKNLATQGQLATFDTMLDTLERVKNHPGLERATGTMAYIPSVKGSDAYNFEQSLDTLKSQAFVPMVASLKGMGALSDAEGKKLTAAVGELDAGMSKEEFKKSIDRITNGISAAKARIEHSSAINLDNSNQSSQPQNVPPGYRLLRNKRTGETKLVKAE
jgi:hypothetical protein